MFVVCQSWLLWKFPSYKHVRQTFEVDLRCKLDFLGAIFKFIRRILDWHTPVPLFEGSWLIVSLYDVKHFSDLFRSKGRICHVVHQVVIVEMFLDELHERLCLSVPNNLVSTTLRWLQSSVPFVVDQVLLVDEGFVNCAVAIHFKLNLKLTSDFLFLLVLFIVLKVQSVLFFRNRLLHFSYFLGNLEYLQI